MSHDMLSHGAKAAHEQGHHANAESNCSSGVAQRIGVVRHCVQTSCLRQLIRAALQGQFYLDFVF